MGIELDPMENIIVATSHDRANESNCDLEIFNAKGRKILDCTKGHKSKQIFFESFLKLTCFVFIFQRIPSKNYTIEGFEAIWHMFG